LKLVVGLGNPGRIYARNRHNVGFTCLDRLAARLDVRFHRVKWADTTVALVNGRRLYLAKPLTFMNESGRAVAALLAQTSIPLTDVIAVYDDLDLPLGALRLRHGGSAGGHKGVLSIIASAGGREFDRVRVGIGRPERGPGLPSIRPRDYVLSDFPPEQRPIIDPALDLAAEAVIFLVENGMPAAMNRFNARR
jgi:PTH1 family peptidyl-tRNA hydrolase